MTTTSKTQTISARILAMVAAGHSLQASVDAILGAGTYERLAGDVYDALRAR